jgi:hypothetical protein
VNQTFKIALAVGLFSLVVGALFGHWLTNNYWKAKWADRDTADAKALIAANETERVKELSWQSKIEKVSEDAKLEQAKITAEAADLADIVDGLRGTIKVSTSKLQSAGATIAELRRTAATTALVQSELSGWCISRIEVMAGIIDRSQSAGLACQRAYEAIRLTK